MCVFLKILDFKKCIFCIYFMKKNDKMMYLLHLLLKNDFMDFFLK